MLTRFIFVILAEGKPYRVACGFQPHSQPYGSIFVNTHKLGNSKFFQKLQARHTLTDFSGGDTLGRESPSKLFQKAQVKPQAIKLWVRIFLKDT